VPAKYICGWNVPNDRIKEALSSQQVGVEMKRESTSRADADFECPKCKSHNMKRAEQLAADHWQWLSELLSTLPEASLPNQMFIEVLYKSAMVHGYKHAVEDSKADNTKRDNINPILTFTKECCEFGKNKRIFGKTLYGEYKKWCNENGLNAMSSVKFKKMLLSQSPNLVYIKNHRKRWMEYRGIGVGRV